MGKIIEVLGSKKISSSPIIHPDRLITEENKKDQSIHVHLRNLRLEFSEQEFADFAGHVSKALVTLQKQEGINADDGREGGFDNYFVLNKEKVKESPGKDLEIELNEKDNIHVHFRDLRMDFTSDEFKEFVKTLKSALTRLEEHEK